MPTTARAKAPTPPRTRYEEDYYTWVNEQVELLRLGRNSEIDTLNVAEELRSHALREKHLLTEALMHVIKYLLRWDSQPKLRSRNWACEVRIQRLHIAELLGDSPGLRSVLAKALASGYFYGRCRALAETEIDEDLLPELCPYSFDQIMTREIEFIPAGNRKRL